MSHSADEISTLRGTQSNSASRKGPTVVLRSRRETPLSKVSSLNPRTTTAMMASFLWNSLLRSTALKFLSI